MILYQHEMKMNRKALLIWTLCVGGLCFGCILLYTSLENSINGIADVYSDMGAMSAALGMDKLSLATMRGYYATEIALMHGLGGAMFAAIVGTGILSKEEAFHTAEFLHTLPIGRQKVVFWKYVALLSNVLLFNLLCVAMYLFGFWLMGEDINGKELFLFHLAQIFMQIEIGTICFLVSAYTKRNLMGAGLGIVILLFAVDMMCRIIPAIENLKYLTPFYYANASDIFANGTLEIAMFGIGVGVTIGSFGAAYMKYSRKDLSA